VNLPDQPLTDPRTAGQEVAHQLEGTAVVQQLADIVGIGRPDLLAGPQLLRLLDAELGILDMGRVVGL